MDTLSYYTTPVPPDPAIGYYRHRKGDLYRVAARAVERNTSTLEWMVRYESVDHDRFNTRPYHEFMGTVDGVPRFLYLGENIPSP